QKLETKRLLFRPPTLEDSAAAFHCYASDAEVSRYLTWKNHAAIEAVSDFFSACATQWADVSGEEGHYPWLLFLRETGDLVGSISVELQEHRVEIGYVFGRAHWNKGYATEALGCVVDWALAREDIFRAWAACDVDNPASARVMEKVGMSR